MVTLVVLVVTVGVLDSVNPSTVGPALYLATRRSSGGGVGAFTVGVFGVSLLGGLVLTLGPGYAIVAALPRPGSHTTALVEVCVGAASSLVALGLWFERSRIANRVRAVIAAIVGSGRRLATQVALLVLFNTIFVAPLVAITAARSLMHNRAEPLLARLRDGIDRHAADLLPALVALVAVALLTIGAVGLLTA